MEEKSIMNRASSGTKKTPKLKQKSTYHSKKKKTVKSKKRKTTKY